jgi:hypothetical protein
VKGLRMGTSYEVDAAAYADAAGTQLISDASLSKGTFTTPALATTAGAANIDETPLSLNIPVYLLSKNYTAKATMVVTPAHTSIKTVRLTLLKNGVSVYQMPATAVTNGTAYTFTVSGLKKDVTSYTVQVDGLTINGTVHSSVTTSAFATTATAGAYQDTFGPFNVTLN